MKMVLVVAAALIDSEDRILLAQRPAGKPMAGLWEFPGGKVDPGELPEQALARELKEELQITVDLDALKPITFASHSYESFHLLMPLYACRKWQGRVCSAEGQSLAWVQAEALVDYPAPAADVPLFAALNGLSEW